MARELVVEGRAADLIIANNVLAHVPDINDFVAGIAALLAPEGVFTGEFPHLLRLIEGHQFDTIYHEHFSYLSFLTIERIFAAHGLTLFDVDEIPTHGGSIRVYAVRPQQHQISDSVAKLIASEPRGVGSPVVKSRIPTRYPCFTNLASVPPQVISRSSGWCRSRSALRCRGNSPSS